ncbi:MAG: hypothetical protein K6U78_11490 [Anaerolineae bacterium]|nr:hypothetical protein [Anaerolineae bacterium]
MFHRTARTLSLLELKTLAGYECCLAYERARQCNGRMPPPATPCAECLAAFGRRLNWRTGDAAALQAMRSLTAQWLVEQHISADLAARWALFYLNEKQRNRRNPSAAGRARFLITAVALLHEAGSKVTHPPDG